MFKVAKESQVSENIISLVVLHRCMLEATRLKTTISVAPVGRRDTTEQPNNLDVRDENNCCKSTAVRITDAAAKKKRFLQKHAQRHWESYFQVNEKSGKQCTSREDE